MKLKYLIELILALVIISCSSKQRLSDFELQKAINDDGDLTENANYITSTIPIDSADIDKLIFDIWRIESNRYPDSIKAYARVYDSLGHFITNLASPYKKDESYNYFAKLDEGLGKVYKKKITNIPEFNVREFGANDSIPYNIVLSVDNSGSMSGVFNAIMDGAELFASMKFKYDRLAVTTFSEKFDVRVPMSADVDKIVSVLKGKRKEGLGRLSSINDALWKSMDIFDGTSDEDPRVMVVFTDGDDNLSKTDNGELIRKANENKIHIFTVAFGYYKDEGLRELSKYTGGKFYKAQSKEELIAVFRDIYMSLRYYYLVTYRPPRYYGNHFVYPYLSVPERKDSLIAEGEYDVSDFITSVEFTIPILFDFNKSDIKPESSDIIDGIIDQMMSHPRMKIEIQGHTDNIGGVEVNQKLSEQRADAVKQAIVAGGIEPERIRTRGFGMSMPIVNNDTEENRAKNRRTQFVILAK